jgi:hypothetical protein
MISLVSVKTMASDTNTRFLSIAKSEIALYVAAKSIGTLSEKEFCLITGSAQTAILILNFSSLSPAEQATAVDLSIQELATVRKQVSRDSDSCKE